MIAPQRVLEGEPLLAGVWPGIRGLCSIRPGGSDDWLLFCTMSGKARIVHPSGEFSLTRGDCLLYPRGQPQDYRNDPEVKSWGAFWVHFHPRSGWEAWLRWPQCAPGHHYLHIADTQAFSAIAHRCRDVAALSASPRPLQRERAMNALEDVLLRLAEHNPAPRHRPRDLPVERCIDRMCADLAHDWSVQRLAVVCGLSPVRFAHRFRAHVGMSPRRFLERQRIERAKELLRGTSMPIGEIASQVGFADPFYFSSRFRKMVGESPSGFRRQQ